MIDIHQALQSHIEKQRSIDSAYSSGDGIHPNASGHEVMARTILRHLFMICLERTADFAQTTAQTTTWKGYERVDFILSGREAIVVKPQESAIYMDVQKRFS